MHKNSSPTRLPARPKTALSDSRTTSPNSSPKQQVRPLSARSKPSIIMPSNATALKLEKLGLKYKYDDGHAVSLENFDQHDTSKVIILTSPRSIDACLKTGISAYELLKRPMSYFTEQGISPEIVEKRAHIYEQKRVEKLKLVREERKKTMDLENSALNYSSVSTEDMEFQRLEKQMRSAKVHMELSIAHEIEMKRKAYETQVRLRQQYEKEQLEKEEKLRQAKEREAQRIKNAVEFKLRTKMLLDMQQQQLLEKRMKMEEKEREHQTYIEETKKKMMEENSMRRSTSNSKVEQTRQESQKIQMKHQMDAIRKQDEFEKRKQEFEEAKQQMKTVLMQKAKTKEEKLNITIERNKMIEKKKQMRAIQKQKDFEEKQRQQQLEHEKETQQRKLLEALKDQKRMEKVEKVKHDDEKRVESIVHQQLEQDEVLQQHLQQLQKEHMLRLEENNLKEQDRKDAVERRKRIAEFKKLQTLAKIEQKNAKADQLADLRASMIEKKIKQREILKRSKQILSKIQPGPKLLNQDEIVFTLVSAIEQQDPASIDWTMIEKTITPKGSPQQTPSTSTQTSPFISSYTSIASQSPRHHTALPNMDKQFSSPQR